MSTRVDAEQIETTRSEKVLAVVLAAFMIVGGVWAYVKVDEISEPAAADQGVAFDGFEGQFVPPPGPNTGVSAADQQALAAQRKAQFELDRAQRQRTRAVADLELAREEFRAAIDAGLPSSELETAYEGAQARLDDADASIEAAQASLTAAQPAAAEAQERLDAAAAERAEERRDHDRQTFLLRLLLVSLLLGGSYLLLSALRKRSSHYLPLGLASVVAAAILALVMVADYGFETVEFEEVGPLAISIIGIAMTIAAFVALQRYIARRVPLWRVRRRDCPFCGHPARDNSHCEGCGREVVAPCSKCRKPRRVGSEHCGACGAA